MGIVEYYNREIAGENVEGLTNKECENILMEFNQINVGYRHILDYHKGKPMKLIFVKKNSGRILVSSADYDARNGKYRFLEALINTFVAEDILITRKGYKNSTLYDLKAHPQLERSKEDEAYFRDMIKNTIQKENQYGKYWVINDEKIINNLSFTL
jgi:hypothetical protein